MHVIQICVNVMNLNLHHCLLRSQNAILILVTTFNRDFFVVDGSWDAHLASPADFFAGADDITT